MIPAGYYADQPYIVQTDDGAWLCVVTTGSGHEGVPGQHLITLRSLDHGETWGDRVEIEPPTGPEASWGVLLKAPSGRLFVFYVYNADDDRELPADDPPWQGGKTTRMDSHGHYVFRWSDDHGRTWSAQRGTIPVREFAIDRENSTGGRVRLFWNVGRPILHAGEMLLTLHKVRSFGAGWFTQSEGALVASKDLLFQNNPLAAQWVTLPEGNDGIKAPVGGGPVAEEQMLLTLSDGSLAVIYRTVAGHPAQSYSRDGGRTWSEPDSLRFADGRRVKHPRAACFAWRLEGGDYVLWFHNHGGRWISEHPRRVDIGYADRNPAWMSRGWEVTTPEGVRLVWGNPEIVLYDDDPTVRMSYPDLIQQDGRMILSETQKAVARTHEVSETLARALREGGRAFSADTLRASAVWEWTPDDATPPVVPELPHFLGGNSESPYGQTDQRAGFSVELEFDTTTLDGGAMLFKSLHPSHGGLCLRWNKEGSVYFMASDGRTEWSWKSDAGALSQCGRNHLVIIVDGGPKIISFLANGVLCDGGTERQFGWGRFSPNFRGVLWRGPLVFSAESEAAISSLRFYKTALLSAEAEALFHRAEADWEARMSRVAIKVS